MKPDDWNAMLAPAVPSMLAGEHVAREVKALLDGGAYFLSTTELADMLYPPQHARGDEGQRARKRLFEILRRLAHGDLESYTTRGEPVVRKRYGRSRVERPIIWHAPIDTKDRSSKPIARTCPHCGGLLDG